MKLSVEFTCLTATNVDYKGFSFPDGGLISCPHQLDSGLELS